ncbi:MAG: S41 family peptidase [SAR324 cluster bacterium]|nr:S41 family peptidase [SAR324 cluster bacterium]
MKVFCLRFTFLAFVSSLALFPSLALAGDSAKHLNSQDKAFEAFSRAFALIQKRGVPQKTTGELTESAINGMLQSLDPYSELYSRKQYEKLQNESMGQYIGIGVQLLPRPQGLTIAKVTLNSPAQKAGLKRGDIFVALNDQTLTPQNEQEVFTSIPNKVGQKIKVTYSRGEAKQDLHLNFAAITESSVLTKNLGDDIYLVAISDFQKNTAQEIKTYFNVVKAKGKKIKGIVLDLRNNPGGLLLSGIETAELFIKEGLILEIKNSSGKTTQTYPSQGFSTLEYGALSVLVNERTASSAEILAGAIKDLNQGKLFGEKTYGKGSIQSFFPLTEELFVKMTMARFYTAGGKSFHKVGIVPDVKIKDQLTSELYSGEDKIFNAGKKWARLKK